MTEHAVAHHEEDVAHDHHDDPDHIRRELRVYWLVFGGLMVLTGITVWLCYGLHMPVHIAIIIALIVASLKGFLVAGFFMHLLSEKKLIYAVLILTVVFFGILLWGPTHDIFDKIGR